MRNNSGCIFDRAWIGRCGKETYHGDGLFCDEHRNIRCMNPSCVNQAITECDSTSTLVCGRPFCQNCGRDVSHDIRTRKMFEDWKPGENIFAQHCDELRTLWQEYATAHGMNEARPVVQT